MRTGTVFAAAALIAFAWTGAAIAAPDDAPEKLTKEAKGLLDTAEAALDAQDGQKAGASLDRADAVLAKPALAEHAPAAALRTRSSALRTKVAKAAATASVLSRMDAAMEVLRKAMASVQTATAAAVDLKRADDALATARSAAADAKGADAKRAAAAKALIDAHVAAIDQARLSIAAAGPTAGLTAALATFEASLETATKAGASDADLKIAADAASKFESAYAAAADLRSSNRVFATAADALEKRFDSAQPRLQAAAASKAAGDASAKLATARAAFDKALAKAKADGASAADIAAAGQSADALDAVAKSNPATEKTDKAYARAADAARAAVVDARSTLSRRSVQLEVSGQTADVEDAKAAAKNAIAALAGVTDDAPFKVAEAAVASLLSTLEDGKALEGKDRGYARVASAAKASATASTQAIADARGQRAVTTQRNALEAAAAKAQSSVDALSDKPDAAAFSAAAAALDAVDAALKAGKALEAKDRGYARLATGTGERAQQHRATIAERRTGVAVDDHRAELTAATNAVTNALTALDGEPAAEAFTVATAAIDGLEKVIDGGGEVAKQSEAYARTLASAKARISEHRTTVQTRQTAVLVAAHRNALSTAEAAVATALEGLAGTPDAKTFDAATAAVDALQKILEDGKPLAVRSTSYGRTLAASTAAAAGHGKTIARRREVVQVAGQQGALDSVIAKVAVALGVLTPQADDAAFEAAAKSVDALETELKAGAATKAKDRAYAGAAKAARRAVPGYRSTIAKRTVEREVARHTAKVAAADTALAQRLQTLKGTPAQADFAAAHAAVAELEKVVAQGTPLAAKRKAYGATLNTKRAEASAHREAIEARRLEVAVAAHKAKLDAATADVQAKLKALDGEPQPSAYQAAEDAVSALKRTIEDGAAVGDKDKAYAAVLKAAAAQRPMMRATIKRRRIEVAKAAATKRIDALVGAPTDADFEAATKAVEHLGRIIEANSDFAAKEKGYAAFLAQTKAELPKLTASIGQRALALEVGAHATKLDAATKTVAERIAALDGSPDDQAFTAASEAVDSLDETIDGGQPLRAKDRTYAERLAAAKRAISGYRKTIATSRTQTRVAAHAAELEAAQAKLQAALSGLEGTPGDDAFTAASDAVDALDKVIDDGNAIAAKAPTHGKVLAAARRAAKEQRAAIGSRKVATDVASHGGKIDEATAEVTAKLAALDGAPAEAAFSAAEAAVDALAAVLEAGTEVAKKDRKHGLVIAAANKTLPQHRRRIQTRRTETAVAAHQAEIESASKAVDEKLASLAEGSDAAAFTAAESAVDSLETALDAGGEVAMSDAKHAEAVKVARGKLAAHRKTVAGSRVASAVAAHAAKIDQAKATVTAKLGALDDTPDRAAFTAAESAVDGLETALDAGGDLAMGDAKHAKAVKAATGAVAGYRKTIASRRVATAVAAHQSEVDAASRDVKLKLDALGGTATEADFAAAEGAIDALQTVVGGATEVAKKDAKHAKFLAGLAATVGKHRKAVAAARQHAAIAAHVAKVDAATGDVTAKLEALTDEATDAAFTSAEQAVDRLASTIDGGERLADENAAHAKTMAAMRNTLPKHRATIERRRLAVTIAASSKSVEAGSAKVAAALGALEGTPDVAAFAAATKAVDELERILDSAASLGAKDKAYAKTLAVTKKATAAALATIGKRQVEVAVAAHTARVDASATTADAAIAGLSATSDESSFNAAASSVDALERVLNDVNSTAKGDGAYAKSLAAKRKGLTKQRAAIERKRHAAAVAAQLALVEAAAAKVNESLDVLEGAPAAAAFAAAATSVDSLEKALDAGAAMEKKDRQYAKQVGNTRKAIPTYRRTIAKRQIERDVEVHDSEVVAAEADVNAALAALEGEPDDSAFEKAKEAVAKLERVVGAGSAVAAKAPKYNKTLAAKMKGARAYKQAIEKRRLALEVAAHAAKLAAAEADVQVKLSALEGDPAATAYQAAEDSVSSMKRVIEDGEALADRDAAYAKVLAKARAARPGFRAKIKERRLQVALDKATASIDALQGAPAPEAFEAAEKAVSWLENVTDANSDFADKHKGYATFLAGVREQIPKLSASIGSRRVQVEVDAHVAKVDAAMATAAERIGALEGTPAPAAFSAANEALDGALDAIDAGEPIAAKSKSHAKYLAGLGKTVKAQRAKVAKRAVEVEVDTEREKVAAAVGRSDEGLVALEGAADAAAFTAASDGIDALEQVLDGQAATAAKDKGYAKWLASTRRGLTARRVKLNRRRVEVGSEAVTTSGNALDGDAPAEADFAAAESALEALQTALGSAQDYVKADKALAKLVRAQEKAVKAHQAKVASKRIEAEIRPHRAEVEAAVAKVSDGLGALAQQTAPEAFTAADELVATLERTLSTGEPLADKSKRYGTYLAATQKKVPTYKRAIEKRRQTVVREAFQAKMDSLVASVDQSLASLSGDAPSAGAFTEAEDAIGTLETAVERSEGLAAKDAQIAKYLTNVQKGATSARRKVALRKAAQAVAAHRAKVEAARAAADQRILALQGKPPASAYQDAEDAVSALKRMLDEGEELKGDKAYGAYIASQRKARPALRAAIKRHRIQSALDEANARFAALDGEPGEAEFEAANKAVSFLESVTDANSAYTAKDKDYAKFVGAVRKKIPAIFAAIGRRRVEVDVAAHAAKVEAANSEALAMIEAIGRPAEAGAPSPYSAASDAVEALQEVIDAGEPTAAKSKKHAAYLAELQRSVKAHRRSIDRAKVAAEIAGHRAQVDEAVAKVDAGLAALEGQPAPADFTSAVEAVDALEALLDRQAPHTSKSKAYAKHVAKLGKGLGRRRAAIHRRRIEVASERASASFASLSDESESGAFDAADNSLSALETALGEAASVGKADAKLAKLRKALSKKTAAQRQAVKKKRLAARIRPHRSKVEAKLEAIESQVAALEQQAAPEDFSAADDAISGLQQLISEGEPLGEESKPYASYLAKKRKRVPGLRKRIEKRRRQVVRQTFQAKMGQLAESAQQSIAGLAGAVPSPGALTEAEDSVAAYEAALDRSEAIAAKDKQIAKFVTASRKSVPKMKATIARRRSAKAIADHREGVEAALVKVDTALSALAGEPEATAYQDAEDTVSALRRVIESGEELAEKDPTHRKYLLSVAGRRPAFRAAIKQRRIEIAIAAAEAKVDALGSASTQEDFHEATEAVSWLANVIKSNSAYGKKHKPYAKFLATSTKAGRSLQAAIHERRISAAINAASARMDALGGQSDEDAFGAASRSLRDLESVLDESASLAKKNKRLGKLVSSARKELPKQRVAIHRRRVEVAGAAAAAAIAELDEEATSMDFSSATEAVEAFESTLDGKAFDKKGSKLAKVAKAARSKAKGLRKKIEQRRFAAEVAPHKKSITESLAKAEVKVEALAGDEVTGEAVEDAKSAVDALTSAIDDGAAFVARNKAFKKLVGNAKRSAKKHAGAIRRFERAGAQRAHAAGMEAALATAEAKIEALGGESEESSFEAAGESVDAYADVVAAGKSLGKGYAKTLKGAKKRVSSLRLSMHRKRIDSATEALAAHVAALHARSEPQAFAEAENATGVVTEALKALKAPAKKNKTLKKLIAKTKKTLPKYRAKIAAKKLEASATLVSARIESLSPDSDAEAFNSAQEALYALKTSLKQTKDYAKRDKALKSLRRSLSKDAKGYAKKIQRIRLASTVQPHKARIEEATSNARSNISALEMDTPTTEALAAAEQSVDDLGTAIYDAASAGKKSKAFGKYLAKARKRVGSYRKAIARRRGELSSIDHKTQVEDLKSQVEARLKALRNDPEPSDYQAAEDAVSALGRALDEGEAVAEHDKKYAKYLSRLRKLRPAYRAQIRRMRIESAFGDAKAKLAALEGDPGVEDFEAMRDAMDWIEKVVSSNRAYAKQNKAYARYLKSVKKRVRRLRIEVASVTVEARLKALEGEPDNQAFASAEDALRARKSLLKQLKRSTKKDKKLRKLVSDEKKKSKKQWVQVKRRRIETARAEAAAMVEALESDAGGDFSEADDALGELDDAIVAARPYATKNRAFKTYLKSARKKYKRYRARIKRLRSGDSKPKKSKRRRRSTVQTRAPAPSTG